MMSGSAEGRTGSTASSSELLVALDRQLELKRQLRLTFIEMFALIPPPDPNAMALTVIAPPQHDDENLALDQALNQLRGRHRDGSVPYGGPTRSSRADEGHWDDPGVARRRETHRSPSRSGFGMTNDIQGVRSPSSSSYMRATPIKSTQSRLTPTSRTTSHSDNSMPVTHNPSSAMVPPSTNRLNQVFRRSPPKRMPPKPPVDDDDQYAYTSPSIQTRPRQTDSNSKESSHVDLNSYRSTHESTGREAIPSDTIADTAGEVVRVQEPNQPLDFEEIAIERPLSVLSEEKEYEPETLTHSVPPSIASETEEYEVEEMLHLSAPPSIVSEVDVYETEEALLPSTPPTIAAEAEVYEADDLRSVASDILDDTHIETELKNIETVEEELLAEEEFSGEIDANVPFIESLGANVAGLDNQTARNRVANEEVTKSLENSISKAALDDLETQVVNPLVLVTDVEDYEVEIISPLQPMSIASETEVYKANLSVSSDDEEEENLEFPSVQTGETEQDDMLDNTQIDEESEVEEESEIEEIMTENLIIPNPVSNSENEYTEHDDTGEEEGYRDINQSLNTDDIAKSCTPLSIASEMEEIHDDSVGITPPTDNIDGKVAQHHIESTGEVESEEFEIEPTEELQSITPEVYDDVASDSIETGTVTQAILSEARELEFEHIVESHAFVSDDATDYVPSVQLESIETGVEAESHGQVLHDDAVETYKLDTGLKETALDEISTTMEENSMQEESGIIASEDMSTEIPLIAEEIASELEVNSQGVMSDTEELETPRAPDTVNVAAAVKELEEEEEMSDVLNFDASHTQQEHQSEENDEREILSEEEAAENELEEFEPIPLEDMESLDSPIVEEVTATGMNELDAVSKEQGVPIVDNVPQTQVSEKDMAEAAQDDDEQLAGSRTLPDKPSAVDSSQSFQQQLSSETSSSVDATLQSVITDNQPDEALPSPAKKKYRLKIKRDDQPPPTAYNMFTQDKQLAAMLAKEASMRLAKRAGLDEAIPPSKNNNLEEEDLNQSTIEDTSIHNEPAADKHSPISEFNIEIASTTPEETAGTRNDTHTGTVNAEPVTSADASGSTSSGSDWKKKYKDSLKKMPVFQTSSSYRTNFEASSIAAIDAAREESARTFSQNRDARY